MKNSTTILVFLVCFFSTAQEKIIKGKIDANGNNVAGINVVNLVNEKATSTDENGEFQILARPDDLLVLSSPFFEYKRKIISEEEYNLGKMMISMIPKTTQLDEVEITEYKNINAVDLGILSKPAKKFTVAERRLNAATTGILDPLINLLSGRTAMLKKGIELEKKEFLLQKINDLYKEDFFIDTLKIPSEQIQAFKFYAVEDGALAEALGAKNMTLSNFRFLQLARIFKQLQDEK